MFRFCMRPRGSSAREHKTAWSICITCHVDVVNWGFDSLHLSMLQLIAECQQLKEERQTEPINDDVLSAMEDMGLDKERTLEVPRRSGEQIKQAAFPLACLSCIVFFLSTSVFLLSSFFLFLCPSWSAKEGRSCCGVCRRYWKMWSLGRHLIGIFTLSPSIL